MIESSIVIFIIKQLLFHKLISHLGTNMHRLIKVCGSLDGF